MSSRVHSMHSQRRRQGGVGGGGSLWGFRSNCSKSWINDGSIHPGDGSCSVYSCAQDLSAVSYRQGRFAGGESVSLAPALLRRKPMWEKDFDGGSQHWNPGAAVRHCSDGPSTSNSSFLHVTTAGWVAAKRDPDCRFFNTDLDAPSTRSQANLEDTVVFMSRDELERCSPSRKDGINHLRETHLRYSYCAFLQNLGIQLNLPQTTIGTAMVLCHRFFVRRSHACHDRFLIATAALFLAAKSEETPCPLNTVLRVSWEICEKHNPAVFQCLLPIDWFEQYRESVIGAEHMILTTLNFELDVQHPYTPLKSVLHKLGLSQSVLLNLALNLINEGLRSSLWLQFKPHHIAAGAAFLAAQFLNLDLAYYQGIWHEFQTTPSILQDVVQQLSEIL